MSSGTSERIADLAGRAGHGLEALVGGATSALVVPLAFRAETRGLLVAFDRLGDDPAFDADDEHLLASFAASAAIAIATAQSVEHDRRRKTVEASEQERRRWARELHDETLQEMGALKVLLQGARQAGENEALRQAVDQAVDQIQLSISSLQGLITELRPAALDELGAGPALEALVKRVAATSGLDIDSQLDLAYEQGRVPTRHVPELESAIYRLVQESLTNIVKHAGAERVEVEVSEQDEQVRIRVHDDGRGFDPAASSEGFGLLGMRERIQMVGGELWVQSGAGEGTTVIASMPTERLAP